jgi:hypothetical protein
MPSKSEKQKRFMAAAAHNPKFAKEAGIRQAVARDFNKADTKSKKLFSKGKGKR